MLYEHLLQDENARWDQFRKAEREAQRREALRENTAVGRIRSLARNAFQRPAQVAAPQTGTSRP